MAITAKMVKDLREMTGAGMMDCKNALTEADGDMDLANDILRKKGMKLVDKKASREANEGLVGIFVHDDRIVMAKVKCETDFVARTEGFQKFMTCVLTGGDRNTTEVILKLGENIRVNETVHIMEPNAATYIHGQIAPNMGRIGVVVILQGESSNDLDTLGKQIAMHVAATNPKAVSVEDLDPEWVENEKRLLTEQALESGKPANIVEKMVEGRMNKILREVTLLDQPFVMDMDKTVGALLKEHDIDVIRFIRMEIGE